MAKKLEGSVLGKRLSVAIVLLAIYSLLMIFMPAVAIKESTNSFTGLQVVFGYSVIKDMGVLGTLVEEYFAFSFLNLLPYLFVVAALVLIVLSKFGVGKKWLILIAVLLFILAAVFFFLVVPFSVPLKLITDFGVQEKLILGNGSFLAAISSALAGLLLLVKSIIKE